MIKSKHNQYVSTPDWFSSKPQETIQTTQSVLPVVVSSSSDTIIQQEPLALHQLTDVASDDNGVIGAVEGAVLKFDGTNWYGDKIEIDAPEEGVEYLFKQVFSKIFTAYDINGNVVDITDINSIINDVSVNYSLWSKGYLSALGMQDGNLPDPVATLHQLADVLSDGTKVEGAEKGSVLKYNGTHWYADEDKGFDTNKLEEYLTTNKFLTKDAADDLFLTPDEGDALFLTQEEGDGRYLLKTIFSTIFTAYDIDGNKVDITDTNTAIDNISVNYNFWSKGYVSALGKQDNESTGGVTALHQLIDVAANDENTAVKNAEKGSVLTYDGTHWYGSKISGNGVIDENEIVAINNKYKYATQKWVEDKNYITDAYSKKEVDDKINEVNTSINNTNTRIDNLIQLVEKEEDAINGVDGVLYILQ